MRAIGLDIGTTTICGIAADPETGQVLRSFCTPNDTFLEMGKAWEKTQDPDRILEKCRSIVDALVSECGPAVCIGVTGQMHGIVYTDHRGEAAGCLYTWQDGRGDLPYGGGQTYAERLAVLTGYKAAAGFGCVTHFYNLHNGLVPDTAACVCTIHDYVAMRLAGETKPRIHASDAAGFGLFRLADGCFDEPAMRAAGLDPALFPPVTDGFRIIGATPDGVPVAAAIGDNQAGFFGSVRDPEHSVLINVGTGGQVSLSARECGGTKDGLEYRPDAGSDFLLVGSSLCGGRAYSILERFFRETAAMAGFRCDSFYPAMDRCLADADADADVDDGAEDDAERLSVSTRFAGTREEPGIRGSIANIGLHNFTPKNLMEGFLEGIAEELHMLYRAAGERETCGRTILVGSGNGIRRNATLRRILERRFGMTLWIPDREEEAAYGAALYALVAAGRIGSPDEARHLIRCKTGNQSCPKPGNQSREGGF